MDKWVAREALRKETDPIRREWCAVACGRCGDCKRGSDRSWSACWSACDACKRCAAEAHRAKAYNAPYFYMLPWQQRKLSETPYAKQFCANVCGVNMCKAYSERQYGYEQCQRCQQQSKCWSQYQQRCVPCPKSQALKSCEQKWGCPSPFGTEFGYVPPVDPMYTDCIPCWNAGAYTT